MLRQALDDAERQQAEAEAAEAAADEASSRAAAAEAPSETTSLLLATPHISNLSHQQQQQAHGAGAVGVPQQHETSHSYGTESAVFSSSTSQEEGEEDDDDDDDEEEYETETDDDDLPFDWSDEDIEIEDPSFVVKIWETVKNVFKVVANVENLWDDTPPPSEHNFIVVGMSGLNGNGHDDHDHSHDHHENRRRKRNAIVFFWFVILATMYATERSTFKWLVDRTGPFRLFAVEMVTSIHCLLLLIFWFTSYMFTRKRQQSTTTGTSSETQHQYTIGLGISVVDIGLMALLDSVALLLVFLTGIHVPPSLTVILIQFTLPLTAFLTQFVHPDGRCSCINNNGETTQDDNNQQQQTQDDENPFSAAAAAAAGGSGLTSINNVDDQANIIIVEPTSAASTVIEGQPIPHAGGLSAPHVWGSIIIGMACILALVPAFISIANPDFFQYADPIPLRTAYNTLLYISSCIPAAASQLYKEHVFVSYKQPVNQTYLNILLSAFQFIFASIISPLIFTLQGLGVQESKSGGQYWTSLYKASTFSEDYVDGLKCYFRLLSDEDQESKYYDDARCDYVMGLTILHAFAIISIGVAVDKIVNAGATKVMYRGMSAGIILGVCIMHYYDLHIPEFSYGPIIDGLNLACLILLVLGSEVYHRVALQGATFETTYPVVETFYED